MPLHACVVLVLQLLEVGTCTCILNEPNPSYHKCQMFSDLHPQGSIDVLPPLCSPFSPLDAPAFRHHCKPCC